MTDYGGRMSRTCSECGLTCDVDVPDAREGALGGKDWWNAVRVQLPWPAMCLTCRCWWNEKIMQGGGYVPPIARAALEAEHTRELVT